MAEDQGNGYSAPAAGLPPGEPDRSLRISIWDGAFAVLHAALTGGALATAYALMLGASNFHLGLLSALPALSTFGGVISSRLIARFGHRKALLIASGPGGRLVVSLLCVLPFLPLPPGWRLNAFIGTIFLGSFMVSMSGTAWTSLMTDLVPQQRRGRYFSVRNAIAGAVGMVSVFAVGKLYDHFAPRTDTVNVFVPFYAFSIVFVALTAILLHRMWEPPLHGEERIPLSKTISIPWSNPDFRRLLFFSASFIIACAFGSPFLQPHMFKNLRMSMTLIATYYMLFQATSLFMFPLWGRVADRLGNRPILISCAAMLGFLYIPWLIAAPDRIWVLWIDAVVSGLCWPGFNLASFNLLLATAPRQNRSSFLAMHSLTAGLAGFTGSMLSGFAAQSLSGVTFRIGSMQFINYHILFFLAMAGRFAALPLAIRLREKESKSVAMLVDYAAGGITGVMNATLRTGITVIRKITRG